MILWWIGEGHSQGLIGPTGNAPGLQLFNYQGMAESAGLSPMEGSSCGLLQYPIIMWGGGAELGNPLYPEGGPT